MTNAIQPTYSNNPYATPKKDYSEGRSVLLLTPKTSKSDTPTKRKLFDSPKNQDGPKLDFNVKTKEKARKILSSIADVPQTPRRAPGSASAAAAASPASSLAFSKKVTPLLTHCTPRKAPASTSVAAAASTFSSVFFQKPAPLMQQTPPQKPALNAKELFSPDGLFLPELSAFSEVQPAETVAYSQEVPPNSLVLTRLPTPTPEASSIEREKVIKSRRGKFEARTLPTQQDIQISLGLTQQTTFSDGKKTYTRGKFLGEGQFFATFATDDPKVVVKVLHEEAILFDLFGNLTSHWEEIQANYAAAKSTQLLARALNGDTLSNDRFILQETVIPLDDLTEQTLKTFPAPLFPQIKHILSTFLKTGIVLECHKKNLGISLASGKVVVYDFDARADFDDNEGNKENALTANFNANIASYGPAAAAYLAAK